MIVVCKSCGKAMFPAPLLCPACGSREFGEEHVVSAVLEDVADRGEVKLGQVRAREAVVIARLEIDDPQRGMQVSLDYSGGIPVARTAAYGVAAEVG